MLLAILSFCLTHRTATASSDGWPFFRGDAQLQGVAAASLPDKPALLWSFPTGDAVKSSAVIASNVVFIGSGDSNIYALNFRNGQKLWSYKTAGPVEAPLLWANGTVYVGSVDGCLYALDAKKGELRWKYKTDDKIMGAPNLWQNGKGTFDIITGSFDYRLHSVDALTGQSNWVYESGNYINGSPAILGNQTVFGGCDGLLHIISLADGKQVKELDAGAYVAASAALANNRAYFGNYGNEFLCVDFSDKPALQNPNSTQQLSENVNVSLNTNVVWRFRDKEFPYFSSAALTKDKVIFGGRDKRLRCLNRETGEEIWAFATQGKVDSSPVVARDKVVFGSDDGRVYLVSLPDGREIWAYEIGEAVSSSPAVADGKFVIGSDDGSVYCFGEKKK